MSITSVDLQNIFYSGFPASTSWQTLDDLFLAIDCDAILYSSERLAPKEKYYRVQNSVLGTEGLGLQEKGHMALKKIAQAWLRSRFGTESLFESYFLGLHPDVSSKDYRFVVECGTTDPSCISIYLDNENVEWVGNIPYPYYEETDIWIHIFRRGHSYMNWRQEKLSFSRQTFKKFHRR